MTSHHICLAHLYLPVRLIHFDVLRSPSEKQHVGLDRIEALEKTVLVMNERLPLFGLVVMH
jgi:hypothetical protein